MKFKKSLGQNLLIDNNIINKIISLTNLNKKNVIEIGSGTGNLTSKIFKEKPKKLICIEKDLKFVNYLDNLFKENKNFLSINEDILKFDVHKLFQNDTVIIGNLPYNISSQILIKFIKLNPWPPKFKDMVFMFQKEVGEKIISSFGSPHYSRLSIITKFRFKIVNFFYVSKNSFFPKPKVDSIVIHFQPILKKEISLKSINSLEFITNAFFSNKRKMVNKTFKKLKINDIKFIKKNKINLSLRPEKITEITYYKIAEYYENIILNN